MEEKHEKGPQHGAKIHVNYMIFRFFSSLSDLGPIVLLPKENVGS